MDLEQSRTRTIDVPVQQLFTKYDRGNGGRLTRVQIAEILTIIFQGFGVNNPVTSEDVENFLFDYDIRHKGDLTREDFEGISKLRFILRESPQNLNSGSRIKIPGPPTQSQLKQIIVPVRMLFDVFNRQHNGKLTRAEIGEVINLIFQDFGMPYEVTQEDVENFLQDFDINHDREITMEDFRDVDILHFDIHRENEMRAY